MWHAPNYQTKLQNRSIGSHEHQTSTSAASNKIEFNGLSGVPTGPKGELARKAAAMQRPHIFISALCLDTLPTTTKHLAKFLKVSEADIYIDAQRGWRICFEDSPQGRDRLAKCYDQFNLKLIFGTYVLNMHCLPDGTSDGPSVHVSSKEHGSTGKDPDMDGDQPSYTRLTENKGRSQVQATSSVTKPSAAADATTTHSTTSVAHVRSSPSVFRGDKDDSSSISAQTGSDATKSSRCHVCQRTGSLSSLEPLARCSTCPRQYHRRCHSKDTFPAETADYITWQCQRCVKRRVPPKHRTLTEPLPADVPISAQFSREPDGSNIDGIEDIDGSIVAVPTVPFITSPRENVLTAQEPALYSDADELVEKMFASSGHSEQTRKKTGRLALVRRKLNRQQVPAKDGRTEQWLAPDQAVEELRSGKKRKIEDQTELPNKRVMPDLGHDRPDSLRHSSGILPLAESIPRTSAASRNSGLADAPANQSALASSGTSSKTKLAPQESQVDVESGVAQPNIKYHKWSGGGGADRAIIQDVFKTLSGDTSTEPPAGQDQQERSAQELAMGAIAEENGGLFERAPTPVVAKETSTGSVKVARAPKNIGLSFKRSKPTKSTCAKCGRTIALNPFGTNIHCVSCKNEIMEQGNTLNLTSSARAPLQQLAGLREREDGGLATPNGRDISEHDPPGDTGAAIEGDPTASTQSSKTKKLDQRIACEPCRVHHKRCNHGVNSSFQSQESSRNDADEADPDSLQQTPNEQHTVERPEQGPTNDSLSELSDFGTEDDRPSVQEELRGARKVIKRRSFKSVARNEYDLGNSFERPKNTYPKLVAMAVGSTEDSRMHSKDIIPWIAANIPGYDLKEGNWEAGIDATVSQYRYKPAEEKQICRKPYWHSHILDASNNAKGRIVELLPGIEDIMPQWDPVLKMPVSPVKRDRSSESHKPGKTVGKKKRRYGFQQQMEVARTDLGKTSAARADTAGTLIDDEPHNSPTSAPPQRAPSLADVHLEEVDRLKHPALEATHFVDAEALMQKTSGKEPLSHQKPDRQVESSDEPDEPIAAARMRYLAAQHGVVSRNAVGPHLDGMAAPGDDDVKPPSPKSPQYSGVGNHLQPNRASQLAQSNGKTGLETQPATATNALLSLADRIKRASETVAYDVSSLFAEWPRYGAGSGAFDKAAKMAEIQARPRRKQRPRLRQSQDPWTNPPSKPATVQPSPEKPRRSPASLDRLTRTPNKTQRTTDPWQFDTAEANVVECDSWDEFFDIPAHPMPILHDGQLAYRDGTRNDDGTLPRAKVILKTGFA